MIQGVTESPAAASFRVLPWGIPTLDAEERQATDAATGSWLALSGRLFAGPSSDPPPVGAASRMLRVLLDQGRSGVDAFDGAFAAAFWDGRLNRLHLVRDAFGIEPLFYARRGDETAFASRVRDLAADGTGGGLSFPGLSELLTWGYVPGELTLDEGVLKVPPGSWIVAEPGRGVVERGRGRRPSFADPVAPDERAIEERFRALLEQAVARRVGSPPVGVLLSGGMDSSSVVSLVRRIEPGTIRTFAFRCAGASFDESTFARALARELGTEHLEVEYDEQAALRKEEAVLEMDVPFCDIGIVTASWLLGEAAHGRVDHVLTGDGGDELWASHPVYAAQRLVSAYERLPVPDVVRRGLASMASRLPDSTRKRDLRVQLKRILPPPGLPKALGAFRWRAYVTPAALDDLLTADAASAVRGTDPLRSVLLAYEGYDGPDDGISRHLYNDYVTASSFYFARLRLLRHFGVEARCPFYDRDLVDFGARIPARLKLEGLERTKRLFRAAMKGVLPEVIRSRKDKLGHSVPLKNWLRGGGVLEARVRDLLSPEAVRRRGLFRPDAVARMFDEHRRLRHNHSHRLWTLYVLEAWLRARGR